jgi:Type III restriction enzyme, res subunit
MRRPKGEPLINIDDWIGYFPPTDEGVRPDQEKDINFILTEFEKGATDVLYEGPTGSGKSFIAETVGQYFNAERYWRTRIFVPTIALQVQYMKDFARLGMRLLMFARNYDCPNFDSCAIGRGNDSETGEAPKAELLLTPVEPPRPLCRCDDCPYLLAKSEFELGAIGVTNLKYGLTCTRSWQAT